MLIFIRIVVLHMELYIFAGRLHNSFDSESNSTSCFLPIMSDDCFKSEDRTVGEGEIGQMRSNQCVGKGFALWC